MSHFHARKYRKFLPYVPNRIPLERSPRCIVICVCVCVCASTRNEFLTLSEHWNSDSSHYFVRSRPVLLALRINKAIKQTKIHAKMLLLVLYEKLLRVCTKFVIIVAMLMLVAWVGAKALLLFTFRWGRKTCESFRTAKAPLETVALLKVQCGNDFIAIRWQIIGNRMHSHNYRICFFYSTI